MQVLSLPPSPKLRSVIITLLLSFTLAGCLGSAGPQATSPGGVFPLFVRNASNHSAPVEMSVIEGYGGTVLYSKNATLAPGAQVSADPVRVPYGEYVLRVAAPPRAREADVIYDEGTQFFRFVVNEDVIAFERHGG